MWPRTTEERNRRRNTGFVCFMNRDDAEEAMEACDDMDVFNNGRLLMVRWGKNVKKERRAPIESQKKRDATTTESDENPSLLSLSTRDGIKEQKLQGTNFGVEPYNPDLHSSRAIRVEIPNNKSRYHTISVTASYIARDPEIEQRLKDEEKGNPRFNFLVINKTNDDDQKESLFYRWRVYSFCHGDTYSIWRTEPFIMFGNESARYWIPPPMDMDAAKREEANAREKENRLRQQKADRDRATLMTGRQLEREIRKKRRGEYGSNDSKLDPDELSLFDQHVRKDLSLSRLKICEAMAFCFDHCVAAPDVIGQCIFLLVKLDSFCALRIYKKIRI